MILGIPPQMWETFGWIAAFGGGFFFLNFIGDRTWRRAQRPIRPAE
ncbi:MAG: hypothetical protein JNM59_03940 [Hyphomonadaceae bacterium]|nr:hypothetical protein [Hyphomonadaceae bacterium]